MSDLESLIHAAAKRGELTYLSVAPVSGSRRFTATYSPASKFGHTIAEAADPVAALCAALKATPKKRAPIKYAETKEIEFG